jgi:hypothetical protein
MNVPVKDGASIKRAETTGSKPEEGVTSQLRDDIGQIRAEMGGTIEELHGRLNPAVLKEQALDQFREAKEAIKAEMKAEFLEAASSLKAEVKAEIVEVKSRIREEFQEAKAAVREATIGKVEDMVQNAQGAIRDASGSVVGTIRANPIPAALAGVGMAWLVISARSQAARRSRVVIGNERGMDRNGHGSNLVHHASDVLGDALRNVGDTAGKAGQTFQRAAGRVAHQAGALAQQAEATAVAATQATGGAIGTLAHQTQDAAVQLAQGAKREAMRLETTLERTYGDNPLAVGAAILAVGTAIGLAIPITRREEDAIGPARDQVFGKAEEMAHRALEKFQDVAHHLGEGGTPGGQSDATYGATKANRSATAPSR